MVVNKKIVWIPPISLETWSPVLFFAQKSISFRLKDEFHLIFQFYFHFNQNGPSSYLFFINTNFEKSEKWSQQCEMTVMTQLDELTIWVVNKGYFYKLTFFPKICVKIPLSKSLSNALVRSIFTLYLNFSCPSLLFTSTDLWHECV
jgi:hypothetical protein